MRPTETTTNGWPKSEERFGSHSGIRHPREDGVKTREAFSVYGKDSRVQDNATCEKLAASPPRRSLRSPDRFIPCRSPTKNALNVPAARRALRTPDHFLTLRSPAPPVRNSGRTATSVAGQPRAVSEGAIWTVGGALVTEGVASTPNGRGGRVTSGTSAPHYTADFLRKASRSEEELKHGKRLALAMDIEQGAKMLEHSSPASSCPSTPLSSPGGCCASSSTSPSSPPSHRICRTGILERSSTPTPTRTRTKKVKPVPIIPFRVLDAPALRDDYYCSLLAYSPTLQCLAVGLGPHVYLWSETRTSTQKNIPDSLTAPLAAHVTSISFSSAEGGSAILGIGRADGRITLWSPLDREPRFDSEQPSPVSCICFRPNTVRRASVRDSCTTVVTEELLVGDEAGNVYIYAIEWPSQDQRDLFDWHGSMTLLARISCHSQQVCGIAWSPDGEFFATGGNDNQLFLFETKKVLKYPPPRTSQRFNSSNGIAGSFTNSQLAVSTVYVCNASSTGSPPNPGQPIVLSIPPGRQKHTFHLNAACKALAFAPWQPSLLAAGGGSNDRCIHFFHTGSGAALATIDCHAQVTSLTFNPRRREVAATFGFAQPEHAYRVAVFSWPSCRMVVGIPWLGEERALWAVAYPRGPDGRRRGDCGDASSLTDSEGQASYGRRTRDEGCLVVATSDASIKFHEVWTESKEPAYNGGGILGSRILEGELGVEDVIR